MGEDIASKNDKNINGKSKIVKLSILVILLLFSALFLILTFTSKDKKLSEVSYIRNITKEVDYKVFLHNNSFIEEEYLEKNEMYISDLVKSIESIFKYNFNSSKTLNISYEYTIVATIEGEYKESSTDNLNNVWRKTYTLLDKKSVDMGESTGFNINEVVNIDYVKYNNEVSEFRKTLKLPLNAYLKVNMNVKVISKNLDNSQSIEDESTVEINIPLNQLAFKIAQNYEPETSTPITRDGEDKINYLFLTLAIVSFVIDIILIMFIPSFKKIIFRKEKSKFNNELNKILKQYGDIIVETTTPIESDKKNVIEVKNFNEMIDLEEELRIPILLYKTPEKNEVWFAIAHDEQLYRYVLKEDE